MSKRRVFSDKKGILAKGGNQCELCGSSDNLHIHHKDLDKSNNSPDNAQVLCNRCHTDLHGKEFGLSQKEWNDLTNKQDLETEKAAHNAWVRSGRRLDEIGGEEFSEFFYQFITNRGVS